MAEAGEIDAGWTRIGEILDEKYVNLFIAVPEFEPKKLSGNFGKAAGSDDNDLCAAIWNPTD